MCVYGFALVYVTHIQMNYFIYNISNKTFIASFFTVEIIVCGFRVKVIPWFPRETDYLIVGN